MIINNTNPSTSSTNNGDTPRPRYILTQNKKRPTKRVGYYGSPKCKVGTIFASRKDCSNAGVHHPPVAGISYSTSDPKLEAGAFSIVLNGGYEDDKDDGNIMVYWSRRTSGVGKDAII
ncbi:hypothetical protein D9756_010323 [Leucocoprinus leucothites]|uniref:YDG domain-containing protein n=1 Tax=Leucocoprinus leucothites TaxID=201217 RepID=A0A8H5CV95_9AGAR|nr:hypothetical protein D9756_010323 [Leucoagaricus leucothites]